LLKKIIILPFFAGILSISFAQDTLQSEIIFGYGTITKKADTPVFNRYQHLSPKQKKTRTWLVASGNVVGYSTVMIGLYDSWYKDYPQSSFHTFNDWPEWKQVDKVGHLYSAYIESYGSMELWRWTGMERKKRIWIGGMSGAFYQTVIEVLDGFSAEWGWSWADFGTNILGKWRPCGPGAGLG
jgi:hypothetical protein